TGKYLTLPRALGQVTSEDEGRMAEAQRMSEAVADPSRVDPSFVKIAGRIPVVSPSEVAGYLTGSEKPVVEPVLGKYGMICAHVALAHSERGSDEQAPAQD